jgi:hypothetical protein
MNKLALVPIAALALAACSQPPAPQAEAPAPASTAIPASNPLKPLLDDRDKAKAVQQKVLDDAEKQRKEIEAAGG